MKRLPSLMHRTFSPRVRQLDGGFAGLFQLDFDSRLFRRNYEDPVLVAALRFMAGNLHHKISVPEIAKKVGVGRQVLERRFRQSLKRGVNEEVTRLRVSKMKRLLVESDQTIGEISHLVGFGTVANMNVMFKRFTGRTPQAYRDLHAPKQAEG